MLGPAQNVRHMTAVSSSVLLHTLLFGTDEELTPAREGLVVNFKALVVLQKYWSSLGIVVRQIKFSSPPSRTRHFPASEMHEK